MAEGGDDSVFIDGTGDVVGGGLDVRRGVSHRDTYPGIFDDRNIIPAVPESHALRWSQAETVQDKRSSIGLGQARWDDVREVRMPALVINPGEDRMQIPSFLLEGHINRVLVNLVIMSDFVKIQIVLREEIQLPGDLLGFPVLEVDPDDRVGEKSARDTDLRRDPGDLERDLFRKRTAVDSLPVKDSQCPVHRDVTVERIVFQVIHDQHVTAA